ncbi:MAG: hypothetical protein ACOYB8_10560 [Eubacteriaceae bacterium]|jgi:hypothetical protein
MFKCIKRFFTNRNPDSEEGFTLTELLLASAASVLLLSVLASFLSPQLRITELTRDYEDMQRLTEIHVYFQSLADMTDKVVIKDEKIYWDDLDNKSKNEAATKLNWFESKGKAVYRYICQADTLQEIGQGGTHTRFSNISDFSLTPEGNAGIRLHACSGRRVLDTFIILDKEMEYR